MLEQKSLLAAGGLLGREIDQQGDLSLPGGRLPIHVDEAGLKRPNQSISKASQWAGLMLFADQH